MIGLPASSGRPSTSTAAMNWSRSTCSTHRIPLTAPVCLPGRATGEDHVDDSRWRRSRFDVKALFESLEPIPEPFTAAQEDRYDDDMHVVDQIGFEELSDRADAAANPDVEVTCQGACLLERGDRVGVDEMKGCSTFHFQYRPRMVRQDNDRGVEDRVVTPPSLPFLVLPGAALRAELVAPHDLHTDPGAPGVRKRLVDAERSLRLAVETHLAEGTRLEGPLHEPRACVAERSVEFLALAGTEAVEGDREVVHADEGHVISWGACRFRSLYGDRTPRLKRCRPSRRRRWLRPAPDEGRNRTGCRSRWHRSSPAPSKGHGRGRTDRPP